jgi:TPR repeat protein
MSDSLRSLPAQTHKPAKGRVFVWGAALSIFAGLCVLGGYALYQIASRSLPETAQSTPGGLAYTEAVRQGADPTAVGVMPEPKILERARTVIAAGDIDAVRIALSRMIESGNASAAVDLGSTYDPNILDALGVRNFRADVAKARAWYQKAQQMGAPEAAGLLESLESSER